MIGQGIRILVTNVAVADEHSAAGRYVRETLAAQTRRNARLVARPDTELVFRFASAGFAHSAFAAFHYLPHLNPGAMIGAVEWAEQQGFDAAVLGCFGDPFLEQIRAAAGIPVVGFGEASILAAQSLGPFGVVTPSEFLVEPTRQQIASMGLSDACVGIVVSGEPAQEQEHALVDATRAIEHFTTAARVLIGKGARALVPGCGILSAALRLAPGPEVRHSGGLTEVDGVPVVDVVGCTIQAAEIAALRGLAPVAARAPYPDATSPENHMPYVSPGRLWNCS